MTHNEAPPPNSSRSMAADSPYEHFDADDLAYSDRYKLLVGCVVPRPIAWVTSISAEGIHNLAPFSFFGVASDSPPVLMFHTNWEDDSGKKDTLRNIEATGQFVVNVADESRLMEVQMSSWEYSPEIDEMARLELSAVPSYRVSPPSLLEAPASMECELLEVKYFREPPHYSSAIFGRVVHWRVRSGLLRDRRMQFDLLRPLGRLAGNRFCTVQEVEVAPARPLATGEIDSLPRPVAAGNVPRQPGAKIKSRESS